MVKIRSIIGSIAVKRHGQFCRLVSDDAFPSSRTVQALSVAKTKRNISGSLFDVAVTMGALPTPSIIRLSSLSTVLLPLQREMVHVGSETQSEVLLGRTCIHGRRAAFDRLLIRIYGPLIRPDPTVRAFASPTVDALSKCSRAKKKKCPTFRFSSPLLSAFFPSSQ